MGGLIKLPALGLVLIMYCFIPCRCLFAADSNKSFEEIVIHEESLENPIKRVSSSKFWPLMASKPIQSFKSVSDIIDGKPVKVGHYERNEKPVYGGWIYKFPELSGKDYAVEMRYKFLDDSKKYNCCGLILNGIRTPGNYFWYSVVIDVHSSSISRIAKSTAPQTSKQDLPEKASLNAWHTIRAEIKGNTVYLYSDGKLVNKFEDSQPLKANGIGYFVSRGPVRIAQLKVKIKKTSKPILPEYKQNPKQIFTGAVNVKEDANFYYLENQKVSFAVLKKDGRIGGGWNQITGERYLAQGIDKYLFETKKLNIEVNETTDVLVKTESLNPLRLAYSNKKLPFDVIKEYEIKNNILLKKMSFTSRNKTKCAFLSHASSIVLDEKFRNSGFYLGKTPLGMLEDANKINSIQKAVTVGGQNRLLMLINFQKEYSFAHYTYKIDDKFCLPFACTGEKLNSPYYYPDGWQLGVSTHKMDYGSSFSSEVHYKIFQGAQIDFWKEFRALPDVQAFYANIIGDRAAWMDKVKFVFFNSNSSFPVLAQYLKRVNDFFDEGDILVFYMAIGDWLEYMPKGKSHTFFGGIVSQEQLKKQVERLHAISPRVKVTFYTWIWSAFSYTSIYKKHPNWFRTDDKNGQKEICYPGAYPNYSIMISAPGAKNYLLDMYDKLMNRYGLDGHYLDGGGLRSRIDWEHDRVDQYYDWQDFYSQWRTRTKQFGNDKVLFFNSRCIPFADCGFMELPRGSIGKNWRQSANLVYPLKVFQKFDPRRWVCPLSWNKNEEPYFSNYLVGLGLKPDWTKMDKLPEPVPYINAAYETRHLQLVKGKLVPNWQSDQKTFLEGYTLKQGNGSFLTLINHNPNYSTYQISADTRGLGLEPGREVFVWDFVMANPQTKKGRLTEKLAREIYTGKGWGMDMVIQPKFHGIKKYNDCISLERGLAPVRLHMVMLTHSPALIYSINGGRTQFWLPSLSNIELNGSVNTQTKTVAVNINSPAHNGEALIYFPADWAVADIKGANKISTIWWNKERFIIVPFSKGKSTITINGQTSTQTQSWVRVDAINHPKPGEELIMRAAGDSTLRKGVIELIKDGILYYAAEFDDPNHISIPIPSEIDGGKYYVQVFPLSGNANKPQSVVSIPKGTIDLKVTPNLKKAETNQNFIDVNGKVDKWEFTRLGIETNDGFAGTLPSYMARIVMNNSVFSNESTGMSQAHADIKGQCFIEAGTYDYTESRPGHGFAGIEIKNCPPELLFKVHNTVYGSVCVHGSNQSTPAYYYGPTYMGFVVDYQAKGKYVKRVGFSFGNSAHLDKKCFPGWGKGGGLDQHIFIKQFDSNVDTVSLEIAKYAPEGWDGNVWLSLGTCGVMPGRRLKAEFFTSTVTVKAVKGRDISEFSKQKTLTCLFHKKDFVLDGKLDSKANLLESAKDFFILGSIAPAKQQTRTYMQWNSQGLYAYVICEENIKKRLATNRGNAVWLDDCIQFLIKPAGSKTYCFIINSENKIYTGLSDKSGNAVKHKFKILPKSVPVGLKNGKWILEVFFPYNIFDVIPKEGDIWEVNILRNNPPMDAADSSRSSSWNKFPEFGKIKFVK
jgi:hypothetical protein